MAGRGAALARDGRLRIPACPHYSPRRKAPILTGDSTHRLGCMFTIARVLLAGSEEAGLIGLRQVLESAGHVVSHASTVEEAMRRVLAADVDVLVLTDGLE